MTVDIYLHSVAISIVSYEKINERYYIAGSVVQACADVSRYADSMHEQSLQEMLRKARHAQQQQYNRMAKPIRPNSGSLCHFTY